MTLKLITSPSELVTVDEAKLHLRVEHSADDALIASLITSAREDCEHIIGRGIGSQTWRRTLDAFPVGGIQLGMPPVNSITSIQYTDTLGATQTLAGAAYVLDNESDSEAWVLPSEGYEWPDTLDTANAVRVQFVCGLTTLPATIRAWMLLRVGTLYAHRGDVAAGQNLTALPNNYSDRLLDRWRVWSA